MDMARPIGKGSPGWIFYLLGLLGLFCIIVDYQVARMMFRWADDVEIYNQLLAFESGNILLNHWVLAVDNFYLAELPFYVFLSWIFGDPLSLVNIVPVFVFILIVLAACGLVWQSVPAGTGRILGLYIVLFLIALPLSPGTRWVLRSAYHNGSILYALTALNLITGALSGKGFNKLILVPFFLIVFVASSSDPFFDIFCSAPLLIFLAIRAVAARKISFDEAAICLCTIAAVLAGMGFISALPRYHGFVTMQIFSSAFVDSTAKLFRNVLALVAALEQLFNASLQTSGRGSLAHLSAFMRVPVLAGTGLIVIATIWSICRRRPVAAITQILLFASLCLFGADLVSEMFWFSSTGTIGFPQYAARFVVPIAIFLSVAVAIECPKWLIDQPFHGWRRAVAAYLIVACCLQLAVAGLFVQRVFKSPSFIERMAIPASLVPGLEQQHFTFGVGDYWTTAWIGAASHLRVQAIPVRADNGTVTVNHWLCDDSALVAGDRPQFAVMPDVGNDFALTVANLSAAYGKPSRVLDVAGYIVMVFPHP
jgi:hypothetical protein